MKAIVDNKSIPEKAGIQKQSFFSGFLTNPDGFSGMP
jgi:hypothetical protein